MSESNVCVGLDAPGRDDRPVPVPRGCPGAGGALSGRPSARSTRPPGRRGPRVGRTADLALGGEAAPKPPKWPSEAGLSSARTGRSRPCEGDDRRRVAAASKAFSELGTATECDSSAIISSNRCDGTQAASKGRKRSLSTAAESSQRGEAAVLARLSLAREPSHE